eukprot:4208647-Lingulodinium_polyedra.AAC.1
MGFPAGNDRSEISPVGMAGFMSLRVYTRKVSEDGELSAPLRVFNSSDLHHRARGRFALHGRL